MAVRLTTKRFFNFFNVKTQGYEILKSDSVHTLNSQHESNPRGQLRKISSKIACEIKDLLETEPDAQYMT